MANFYFVRRATKLRYYGDVIATLILLEINRRTRLWCLKCVIVHLARDIPPFVMYCVCTSSSSDAKGFRATLSSQLECAI